MREREKERRERERSILKMMKYSRAFIAPLLYCLKRKDQRAPFLIVSNKNKAAEVVESYQKMKC